MAKTTYLAGTTLLALSLSACSDVNDYKPESGMDAQAIFGNACASCHGEGGSGKLGFLLKIAGCEKPAEVIVQKISQGGTIMPAFPNISLAEAEAIAKYLKGESSN